jgi:ABC-type bacteriocin/lantibiotic exporter with double-glycine peptidase domain
MQFKPASISISNNQLFSASMFVMIWKCTGARQIIACVLAVGVALLHIAPIEIQRQAVDYAIPAPDLNLLLILSLAYLGLVLAYQLSKFVLNTYQIWIGESINQFLRHRIIGTERQNHSRYSNEIASVMVDETAQFGQFAGEGISQVCIDLGMLIGVISYMFWVEPKIATIALFLLVPQAIITPFMQIKLNALINRKIRLKRELGRDIVGTLADFDEASMTTSELFHNNMRFAFIKFLLKACLGLMSAIGPILIIGVGGYFVIRGQTSLGVVVAFFTGFSKVQEPIHGVILFYRNAAQANIRYELIVDWLKKRHADGSSMKG